MFRSTLFLILLIFHVVATGQVVNGIVIDKANNAPIQGVTIINRHTGIMTISGAGGNFALDAGGGDELLFSHLSYTKISIIVHLEEGGHIKAVMMEPLSYKLKETTITRTKYQKDSTERHQRYEHELNRPLAPKPKIYGLACAGCIGWLADKITGNSKKAKAFRKKFVSEDESKFIDSRYNIELVASVTGLTDTNAIIAFINSYPIDYDFARAASGLELQAWVRNNYKEYLPKHFVKRE